MALTQQFARATPEYLERCRASALDSPGAAPGWAAPPDDLLDTDWAVRGLLRYCRSTDADPDLIALLDRAVSGAPAGTSASSTTRRCTTVSTGHHSSSPPPLSLRSPVPWTPSPSTTARRGQCVLVWTD